jgi:hypothetical protein
VSVGERRYVVCLNEDDAHKEAAGGGEKGHH